MYPKETGRVPNIVIARLPLYLRGVRQALEAAAECVTSTHLGEQASVPDTQVRKDLSHFGKLGQQGRGYPCVQLESTLRTILGLDRTWNVAVVGAGRLGRAIISYPDFTPEGFVIKAVFDSDRRRVNTVIHGIPVRPLSALPAAVRDSGLSIAIVTVPERVQDVVDTIVASGITAILNYAPVTAQAPSDIAIRRIDPILALQSLTYFLSHPSCDDRRRANAV